MALFKKAPEILLKLGMSYYYGWKEVQIFKSINNGCGGFSLRSSERYPDQPELWTVKVGTKCTVEIEGQTVITGYIDDINISYDYQNHSIEIIGRDNTSDLVDCNYPEETSWQYQSLYKMLVDVCFKFGVEVAIEPSVTAICLEKFPGDKVTIQCSDTVFDFINKLCQVKAVLPVCYGDGKLTITRAGTNGFAINPIELGYNIISGRAEYSNKNRFSQYMVKGQSAGKTTINSVKDIIAPSNTAKFLISRDLDIHRYRPKVIAQDGNATTQSCKSTADWYRNVAAGNSRKFTYKLIEWLQGDSIASPIWDINQTVQVKDPTFGLESFLLISSINYRCSESEGTTTELTLVDPKTYTPMPFTLDKKATSVTINSINDLVNVKGTMDLSETQEDFTDDFGEE
jgi:prophage tail gpP-like protein